MRIDKAGLSGLLLNRHSRCEGGLSNSPRARARDSG
jgi:hypothetical protein